MNRSTVLKRIRPVFGLYKAKGGEKYMIGENLTQEQHAIQAWRWMRKHPESTPEKRVSALFHDIGHLLYKQPIDPKHGVNDFHEYVGSQFLKTMGFKKAVWAPVSLHVDAKRYLSTEYRYDLSPASRMTLELQGGKMTLEEKARFLADPFHWDAIVLRICDDKSKNMSPEELDKVELEQILHDISKSLTD